MPRSKANESDTLRLSIEALCWQLAGARKPCPNCDRNPPHSLPICGVCKGIGRVYVFSDRVRPWCRWCGGKNSFKDCKVCHGLGYAPSDRLDDWIVVFREAYVGHTLKIEFTTNASDIECYIESRINGKLSICNHEVGLIELDAFISVLQSVILTSGATLGKVPERQEKVLQANRKGARGEIQ